MKKGFYTIGLAYPVIPYKTARLRIIVTAQHTNEQIDGLIKAFKEIADECDFFNKVEYPKTTAVKHSNENQPPMIASSKL